MSARSFARALERLAAPQSVLAPHRRGEFGVFPKGDRRRRPVARLSANDVRELVSSGAIVVTDDGGYVLSSAGRARAAREFSAPGEAFTAQHRPVIDRHVLDDEGALRLVRGHDPDGGLRRLASLRDANGRPWFDSVELAAAARLKQDWNCGEIGLVRGADWRAPPKGAAARNAHGQETAMAARCDARARLADALARLAPPLRAVVERVVLADQGLEMLERAEGWPARSGKLALKLALAQLAEARGE